MVTPFWVVTVTEAGGLGRLLLSWAQPVIAEKEIAAMAKNEIICFMVFFKNKFTTIESIFI